MENRDPKIRLQCGGQHAVSPAHGSDCGVAGMVATDEAGGRRGARTPAADLPSPTVTSAKPGKHLAGSCTVDGRQRRDTNPRAVVGMSKITGGNSRGGGSRHLEGREVFSPCRGGGHGEKTGGGGKGKQYASTACSVVSERDAKWQHEDKRELEDGVGGENDCEDADSAYVTAMEQIWAEAEAWVDAEAQVK